jgi:hypothetical protein
MLGSGYAAFVLYGIRALDAAVFKSSFLGYHTF